VRPRPDATRHCSVKSGEISSTKPERVHMGGGPFVGQAFRR
jgi:hypothetical protein